MKKKCYTGKIKIQGVGYVQQLVDSLKKIFKNAEWKGCSRENSALKQCVWFNKSASVDGSLVDVTFGQWQKNAMIKV